MISKSVLRVLAFIALAAAVPGSEASAQDTKLKARDLPETYAKWLEEEVPYIISPAERDVFLKLRSDRERDLFIEAFWKHRDTNPATEENEFRREHYRRIGHANRYYGRVTPKPGWKTDRGRIYIILGEPTEVQEFEGGGGIHGTEVWFYQNQAEKGLPSGFYLVFFQKKGIGDHILYSPVEHGPMALLTTYWGDPMNVLEAYDQLYEVQPSLAAVAMSLIPGEQSTVFGRPSLSSQMLLQRVETASWKTVEDRYARKFLEYKDIVEVEYSANYIDSDSLVRVFQAPNGLTFIHYSLELTRLSVAEHDGLFSTTFRLNGTLTAEDGRLVYQFEKALAPQFDRSQFDNVQYQPFVIHDMIPVVPGSYRLSILVKNEISKEFTAAEQALSVPGRNAGLRVMPLLLAYKAVPAAPAPDRSRPFQLAGRQFYAQANRVFVRSDTLALLCQVLDIPEEVKDGGECVFTILQDGRPFRTFSRPLSAYGDAREILESIPLGDFPTDHYTITVDLSFQGRTLVSVFERFEVSHRESIPRPWVYAKVLPGPADPEHLYALGLQLHNLDRLAEARYMLEKAVAARPRAWEYALALSQTCLAAGDYERVDALLSPFLGREGPAEYDVYVVLGRALQEAGRLERAVEVLDSAVAHFGVNTALLNSLGECYLGLGRAKEARIVWEKSLELSPDQPALRERLGKLPN
ncbi:MAG: GWxTD domain-containing protein [Candidatus Aminicenantales bacterium]